MLAARQGYASGRSCQKAGRPSGPCATAGVIAAVRQGHFLCVAPTAALSLARLELRPLAML